MAAAYGAAVDLPKSMLVAAGGAVGAGMRWAALDLTGDATWALVSINSAGAFLLGMIVHGVLIGDLRRRLLVGTGFCGALTTFSTFAVDLALDLDRGAWGGALALTAIGMGAGLAAGAAGMATFRETP